MKKMLFVVLCFLCVTAVNAQEVADYKFTLDQDGECEISDTITIQVSKATCYHLIKSWLYASKNNIDLDIQKDVKNEELAFRNTFVIEKRFNSFAGEYSNNLETRWRFKILDDGRLAYRIYHISLVKSFNVAVVNKLPVAERINKINIAKQEIERINNDSKMSKSERRAALEEQNATIEDAELLGKGYDVLQERLNAIITQIHW